MATMMRMVGLCLFSLFVSVNILTVEGQETSKVVILTKDNFDVLTAEGKWLVEFYAPWCGHCKKLNPILDEASLILEQDGVDMKIGKVDCTVETQLGERFGVRAYPTVKYMRGGMVTPYEGGRKLQDITAFAKKVTSPSIHEVTTERELEELRQQTDVLFVLFGGSENVQDTFVGVASTLQDAFQFARAPIQLKKVLKDAPADQFFLAKLSDNGAKYYNGPITQGDVSKWVTDNRFSLVTALGSSNWGAFLSSGKKTVIIAIDPVDPESKTYVNIFRKVAPSFTDDFVFGSLDGSDQAKMVENYGVFELPGFFVMTASNVKSYYPHTLSQVTEASLRSHLKSIQAGRIEPERVGGWMAFAQDQSMLVAVVLFIIFVVILLGTAVCCLADQPKRD